MSISRITYRQIILAALAIAVAAFVGGTAYYYLPEDGAGPETRRVFDPIWQSCSAGDFCVAVMAPCGTWESVRQKYKSQATAYYQHMISVVDGSGEFYCAKKSEFGPPPPAICKSGRCTIVK